MFPAVLQRLGLAPFNSGVGDGQWLAPRGEEVTAINPSTGAALAQARGAARADYDALVEQAQRAFLKWRLTPAPARGEIVRRLGDAFRRHKNDLGMLISLENGKILGEGLGEAQEMIDICDFAVGLSRQLAGATLPSERPRHRLFEQWHPLGVIGVITAFNFPMAVWAWNAAIAEVCGDCVIWKPSSLTPLCALAVQRIVDAVLAPHDLRGVFSVCVGAGAEVGGWLADDRRVALVSATGGCAMGRRLAPRVAARLGRCLLELGGNNAAIVTPSANQELALRAVLFAAVGTAGQRCTSLRRLFVHESVHDEFLAKLTRAYASIRVGDPCQPGVLMGPLIREAPLLRMQSVLADCRQAGAEVALGGERLPGPGFFVTPAIVRARPDLPLLAEETFAPLLYVMAYRELDEALAWNNAVPQGLASAIFTDRVSEMERFLAASGSDCGIANVNAGTSGAEIGAAFGGEKDTGGGREAGSDAWKAYMRRQACVINHGPDLPLAQGVEFG